jgi:oxygen-dependent protoporphyrinogen oxidase
VSYAVVGGGIAGLSAAWELSRSGRAPVTIFEPGRIGGKIRTSTFAGRPVDEGPDAFLVRTPDAEELCTEIGLTDLVPPAAGRTLLWTASRLRPLPDGLVLGVPGRLAPVVRSGILGPGGLARAALDLVLPQNRPEGDVSVGRLVAGRFGRQVATRLVEPLLGGIHAASLDELSAELTAPQLLAAARQHRSLLLGLRAQAAAAGPPGRPIFLAPAGGNGQLVDELEKALRRAGVEFRAAAVDSVGIADPDRISLAIGDEVRSFAGAVLAVPAPAAARLLGPEAPTALGSITFTSVAVLTVSVPAAQWAPPAGFNGFLVPHDEDHLMTACSFFSNKWPGPTPDGHHILRASAGHSRDRRVDGLDDEALTHRLLDELSEAVGHRLQPDQVRLSRWPGALPLYRVGHGATVDRIEGELAARSTRLALAGSSYRGAGIPACVKSGRGAARRVAAGLGAAGDRGAV